MKLNKFQTNVIGIIALVAVGVLATIDYQLRKKKLVHTQAQVEELAQKFAEVDKSTLLKWNSNQLRDVWGSEFKVETDSILGARFTSAGPDKTFDSKDDICSEFHQRTPVVYSDYRKVFPEPVVAKEESKVGNLWSKVKEKKWNFEFKWGKDADDKKAEEGP